MYDANNYISALLTEPFCDLTEEYEELLKDWYGDDLSLFDIDDEDLASAVRRLTDLERFWFTSTYPPLTSYEKLRRKYETLLAIHSCLIEAYENLRDDNEKLVVACRQNTSKIAPTKINCGCGYTKERRHRKNDESNAA